MRCVFVVVYVLTHKHTSAMIPISDEHRERKRTTMITVYEVYSKQDGFISATHLTEASADQHVSGIEHLVAKRAVETDTTEARITFNESLIGKMTGSRSVAAARGGKVRTSHYKDVTKKVKITGLNWNDNTLTGTAKVSGYLLTVERTLQSGWRVVSSEKISK